MAHCLTRVSFVLLSLPVSVPTCQGSKPAWCGKLCYTLSRGPLPFNLSLCLRTAGTVHVSEGGCTSANVSSAGQSISAVPASSSESGHAQSNIRPEPPGATNMQRPSVSAVSPSIAQQHSALKRQSPSTALSRLAKLAKLSPVIRQPQPYSPSPLAPPVQQQVAAAQPDWHTAQGIDKSKGTSVQLSHNQPHSPPAAPASAGNHSSPPLKHSDADTSAPGMSEAAKTEDVRDQKGMQCTCLNYIVELLSHAVRQCLADSCSVSVCTVMWGLTSLPCKASVHAFISSHSTCLRNKTTR